MTLSRDEFEALRARVGVDGLATPDDLAALEPYRVRNAVMLAAGLSTRFAPVSYERPKGLLRVRGQVLVERQIEQLLEAGITDITLVVGYKAEAFRYLAAKYGVRLLENDEYASRNNAWSLWLARNLLGNTYVCSSDDWFAQNPFEHYVYASYYATSFEAGPTEEWCVTEDGSGRITEIDHDGRDAWALLGHVYLDRDLAVRLVRCLGEALEDGWALPELWDEVLRQYIGDLPIQARHLPAGMVHEFDTLDQLAAFDPDFLLNFDSRTFDNIQDVLGCDRQSIHDFYPLSEGLTNLSCHFATGEGEYVYRHPGVGTEKLVDRASEEAGLRLARKLGLDSTFIYEDPEQGWKISRFVRDARPLDPSDDDELRRAMEMARRLHRSGARLERRFDFFDEGIRYERELLARGPIEAAGYDDLRRKAVRVHELAAADGYPVCVSHNDFFMLNFLVGQDGGMSLIDWEYAGMSDEASDYGTFVVCCELDEGRALRALAYYLGAEPTECDVRHFFAYVALAGWCWYLWSLVKEAEGADVEEWLRGYRRYAVKYLDAVLAAYEAASVHA